MQWVFSFAKAAVIYRNVPSKMIRFLFRTHSSSWMTAWKSSSVVSMPRS